MAMPIEVLEKVVGKSCCSMSYNGVTEPKTELRLTKFLLNIEATITRLKPCWDFEFEDLYEGNQIIFNQEDSNVSVNWDKLEIDPFVVDNDAVSRAAIYGKLSSLNVPTANRQSMVDKILNDFAFYAMMVTSPGTDCKVLNLEVSIDVHVVDMYVWNDHVGEAGLVYEPRWKKLWIENKLEKVRVADVSTMCSICMEEIMEGSEVTGMPCSHVYHGTCILKWLDKSRSCPLCRFSMPTMMYENRGMMKVDDGRPSVRY